MFIFTWKETGETIVFPTPDDKECEIEPLPKDWKRDLEMDKEWLEFHKEKKKRNNSED